MIIEGAARAGYPGHRNIINEAAALARHQLDAVVTACRRQEKYEIQSFAIRPLFQFAALFRRQIDTQNAVGACFSCLAAKLCQPIAKEWIEVTEQDQRQFGIAPKLSNGGKNPRQRKPVFQGALRRALNGRSIRGWIRKSDPQLDTIGAAPLQSAQDFERGFEVRISRGDKRNERRLTAFLELRKFRPNATHVQKPVQSSRFKFKVQRELPHPTL